MRKKTIVTMTNDVVRVEVSAIVASQFDHLHRLAEAIRGTDDLADLIEAHARIEAARGWAKIHKQAKEMRLQLLVVEVEALVRIVELGGAEELLARDREAAQWLAALTPEQRSDLIAQSGSATTAAGMVRQVRRQNEVRRQWEARKRDGAAAAQTPPPPDAYDEDAVIAARDRVTNLSAVVANLAEEYIASGRAFTVDELAEEIIFESGIARDVADDEAFREGLKEVSRRIIRSTPPLMVEGIEIPRFVTVRLGGGYKRIPVVSATLAHLDSDIAEREAQIACDQAKLQKMVDVRAKLAGMLTAEDDVASVRISAILARAAKG